MRIEQTGDGDLRIVAEKIDRALLRRLRKEDPRWFETDRFTDDLLEDLLSRQSGYDRCGAGEIGSLTEAPILCTRSEKGKIVDAWGFMDYALRSVQGDLLTTGIATFTRG